jgi:hypothetical protein
VRATAITAFSRPIISISRVPQAFEHPSALDAVQDDADWLEDGRAFSASLHLRHIPHVHLARPRATAGPSRNRLLPDFGESSRILDDRC